MFMDTFSNSTILPTRTLLFFCHLIHNFFICKSKGIAYGNVLVFLCNRMYAMQQLQHHDLTLPLSITLFTAVRKKNVNISHGTFLRHWTTVRLTFFLTFLLSHKPAFASTICICINYIIIISRCLPPFDYICLVCCFYFCLYCAHMLAHIL